MDSTEQRIANLESRVTALEAKAPKPMVMGDGKGPDDLFGGKAGTGPVVDPTDPEYLAAFGKVFGDGGRLMSKATQTTWERRKKAWGGRVEMPESDAVEALLDYYTLLGKDLQPEAIRYGGKTALVFQAEGLGYGTPQAFLLSVERIEQSYGETGRLDGLIDQIEKRKMQ